jgi:F-type H+-transporting ATPase subunit b
MSALLSTFGVDWHLLFAQMVNFGILVAALTYLLYKPVMNMVHERERVVAKGVEDAEEAARQLTKAEHDVKDKLTVAEREASNIVDVARKSAGDERNRIVKEAEARAAQVDKDAHARAEEVAAKSLRDSEKEIARLAMLAAAKVMAEKK